MFYLKLLLLVFFVGSSVDFVEDWSFYNCEDKIFKKVVKNMYLYISNYSDW